jgi:hypothetical protein
MPYNLDFSKIENVKTIEVNPKNWVTPLYVEYGITDGIEVRGILSYCWRVKGTTHTFVIPVIRLDFLSSGNYKTHFEKVLETFRDDYLEWKNEGFKTPWSNEYKNEFSRFIII